MKSVYTIALSLLVVLSTPFLINRIVCPEKPLPVQERIPNDWFFNQRAYPYEQINHKAFLQALQTATRQQTRLTSRESVWEFAGPTNIEGRITDIELLPGDPQTIFLGSAQGGVFKSTDAGNNWTPILDNAGSLSIGDIAISQSDPSIIYVGTGEANAGGGSLAYDGTGIYKSTDQGQSWQFTGLEDGGSIGRMVVDPTNPDIVYVAAMGHLFADNNQCGIFKTTDGGTTWQQKLFISDSTGAIDVVINPQNPNIIYAAMWERVRRPNRRSYGGETSGIYKSTDGGENWTELSNGLPTTAADKGRIGIDISNSNPEVLYAIYADRTGYFKGIYKTTNGGSSWTQKDNGIDDNAYASYGWWFGRIKADPVNSNIAYVIGFFPYKTTNGGNQWYSIGNWDMHVDQHAMAINPNNNSIIYIGNDGGFYSSSNGGTTWGWSAQLPITQFYSCEVEEQNPHRIYGGAQDNGINRTPSGSLDDWEEIYGGDGLRIVIDPQNNNYIYAESQRGNLGRSSDGGESFESATSGISYNSRFNWNAPIALDPQNPKTVYFGAQYLYKSTNHADYWTSISGDLTNGNQPGNLTFNTLTTISVSPLNSNLIYTGSDDGNVWFTANGGTNWTKISDNLPNRWITSVVADPTIENRVYVTISGYRWDEYIPHVLRSDDNGTNWVDISTNLPESPVNEIVIDPVTPNYLYVATDMGVYYSDNNGDSWYPAGNGMPIIVVNDLRLHNPSRTLIAATYGRGMYKLDLDILTNLNSVTASKKPIIHYYPNPFSDKIYISFDEELENAEINIINIQGITVANVFSGNIEKNQTLTWNGNNNSGNRQPPGVYFVILTESGKVSSKKIVIR